MFKQTVPFSRVFMPPVGEKKKKRGLKDSSNNSVELPLELSEAIDAMYLKRPRVVDDVEAIGGLFEEWNAFEDCEDNAPENNGKKRAQGLVAVHTVVYYKKRKWRV